MSLYVPKSLHSGRARDVSGIDRVVYRLFEILPGLLSWTTLVGMVLLSFYQPTIAAYLIIIFSLFWLLKTVYLSIHLRHNWRRLRYNLSVDWTERLTTLKHEDTWHLVILPYYDESLRVVETTLKGLVRADGNKKQMIVVLATEARAGEPAQEIAQKMKKKYSSIFGHFLITIHPEGVSGELAGKGSNISFAAEEARAKLLDPFEIPYEKVIVSAFDIDTVVYPQYFQCLLWHFLTTDDAQRASFQPVPLYNNNIWEAPAFSRVVATSGTFWQMIQQERPEKLATFSSHALSFRALHDVGYWQRNVVSEDSRIYWNLFFAHHGAYRVIPISYPVSMDANLAPTTWATLKNVYRQNRRWTWGVENVPYILYHSLKNARVPLKKRFRAIWVQMEGFWSLATHPIILFSLGWLPLLVGGREFSTTILSYNLPIVARSLLTLAMSGLIVSAVISSTLLPPRPKKHSKYRHIGMVLQWLLVPLTMTVFSAIPGLDAQTRLMFGRYLGFWVTPKHTAS